MKPLLIAFCLLVGCAPPHQAVPHSQPGRQSAALFTDSSIYRAQCKEADTLPTLRSIPQKCTLRDQRVMIR
jgi:hypothetical protein